MKKFSRGVLRYRVQGKQNRISTSTNSAGYKVGLYLRCELRSVKRLTVGGDPDLDQFSKNECPLKIFLKWSYINKQNVSIWGDVDTICILNPGSILNIQVLKLNGQKLVIKGLGPRNNRCRLWRDLELIKILILDLDQFPTRM